MVNAELWRNAMKQNQVKDKSYQFALRTITLCKQLREKKNEYHIAGQLIRSGTSIGANVEEANAGQSKKDFIAKMSIASKEARETHYWIRLLTDSDYIDKDIAKSLLNDCDELVRLLTAIVKTSQLNIQH
jgi:four helix bundle protein